MQVEHVSTKYKIPSTKYDVTSIKLGIQNVTSTKLEARGCWKNALGVTEVLQASVTFLGNPKERDG